MDSIMSSGGPEKHANMCGKIAKRGIYQDLDSARSSSRKEENKRLQNVYGSRALKKSREVEIAAMETASLSTDRESHNWSIKNKTAEAELRRKKQLLSEVRGRR